MQEEAPSRRAYRMERDGYAFVLEHSEIQKLKSLSDFEGREEPALPEDFLRFRVEAWAENLADAGAARGEISVRVDPHQRKVHLVRATAVLFSADI